MAKAQINKHLGKVINGVTIGEEVLRNGRQVKLSATCHCGTKFEVWSLANGYIQGPQLARKENNGNYEPRKPLGTIEPVYLA